MNDPAPRTPLPDEKQAVPNYWKDLPEIPTDHEHCPRAIPLTHGLINFLVSAAIWYWGPRPIASFFAAPFLLYALWNLKVGLLWSQTRIDAYFAGKERPRVNGPAMRVDRAFELLEQGVPERDALAQANILSTVRKEGNMPIVWKTSLWGLWLVFVCGITWRGQYPSLPIERCAPELLGASVVSFAAGGILWLIFRGLSGSRGAPMMFTAFFIGGIATQVLAIVGGKASTAPASPVLQAAVPAQSWAWPGPAISPPIATISTPKPGWVRVPAVYSPTRDDKGFSAEDYEAASKDFAASGEDGLALLARDRAAKLRGATPFPIRRAEPVTRR